MLKIADLAGRADFDAGPLHISPARRSIEGPDGRTTVEPIVMKVFLLLLDARGTVVTRDELFGNAWGGVFVGDDSLNRAIARVRKIAAETAPGLFEIETIPRTGYRLTGDILSSFESTQIEAGAGRNGGISRRTIFGAAAGVGLAGAAGLGRGRSAPGMIAVSMRWFGAARRNWNMAMTCPKQRNISGKPSPSGPMTRARKVCWRSLS